MIFLEKNNTSPWFNLAAEEVALKHIQEDVVMLWFNEPSVVLGKHQNTMAEVNIPFVMDHNIPVIRRISGGGTVYHDLGNLNYSVITTNENRERLIDFQQFAAPVIQFMKEKGHDVHFYGKTNLGVHGQKFSGNAAHVFKNRVLHHGTLLFDTNLEMLEKTIRPTEAQIQDKAVKSVRAQTINLKTILPQIKSIEEFHRQFKDFLVGFYCIEQIRTFSNTEIFEIDQLVQNKYKSTEWNFGYSPSYNFNKSILLKDEKVDLHLVVKKGIIVDLQLRSSTFPEIITQLLQKKLINLPHHPQAMSEVLQSMHLETLKYGMEIEKLQNLLI